MHQNPCFWENCLFGVKNAFYPKTKVVPKTWSYYKTDEKVKFSKLLSLGGVRGSWIRSFWAFLPFLGPHRSHPKIIFFVNFFYHETKNSSRLLELLLFWGQIIFLAPKRQFSQKHGFWLIFPQYSYNKSA